MSKSTRSSTVSETFIDTSGFYAFLVGADPMHARASRLLEAAARTRSRFVTTDYVLDETATLLRARGLGHLAAVLFDSVFGSSACAIHWMEPDRFQRTRVFFARHEDKDWSFTDCFSFCVMGDLKLEKALTTDGHFRQAGFEPLLA
jgi:uncharacterized protein